MSVASILDAFKGLFSRAFWFSCFLPVALIAAIHALISAWVFNFDFAHWIGGSLGASPGATLLHVSALVVAAYAIGPITPLFAAWLEGALMPRWLHDGLRRFRYDEWQKGSHECRNALLLKIEAERLSRDLAKHCRDARAEGDTQKKISDRDAVISAANKVNTLRADWSRRFDGFFGNSPINLQPFRDAAALLCQALKANSAELWNGTAADLSTSKKLDEVHAHFDELLVRLKWEASHRHAAAVERWPVTDATDWQPTRFGDVRHVRDRCCKAVYGVGFDFIWPRVRMAIKGSDADAAGGLPREVVDSGAQADFATLLLSLSLTVPVFWLPTIVVGGKDVVPFVVIGVLAPVVMAILYRLAVQCEDRFGAVVLTAIERHRLDVFPLLNLKRPMSRSAEKALWERLEEGSVQQSSHEFFYVYPE